jgi:hypothetical protein
MPSFNDTNFSSLLRYGIFWTEITAGATAVAKVRKNQDMLRYSGNSMVSTGLSTFIAVGAPFFVHRGHGDADWFDPFHNWL